MRRNLPHKAFAQLGFRIPSAHALPGTAKSYFLASRNVPLCVMKFGGSSVGGAARIEGVARIIQHATRKSHVAVVVSAMSGVTNQLIDAAAESEKGNSGRVASIFQELRSRHEEAANRLIATRATRCLFARQLSALFREGESLCRKTIVARKLTPQMRDAIASLGERLAAPLVAATLAEHGVASEAIAATELIVTDANYGCAEPSMDATRQRCHSRITPLLHQGIVPVVTGFIGATPEGVLTTLGRGGSDYSATILAAALDARDVIIWTDVRGVLTADPRLVPEACTIAEISYREAADLAQFGAKVLHPKTLRPVMQSEIPVWIRSSFAPAQSGTKITTNGIVRSGEVKAVTSIADFTLIAITGTSDDAAQDIVGRCGAVAARVRAETCFISPSVTSKQIQMAVGTALAQQTVKALREEFAEELSRSTLESIGISESVAIVTLVGHDLRDMPKIRQRACTALGQVQIGVAVISEGASGCSLSFGIVQEKTLAALGAIHQEFQLHTLESQTLLSPIL
jgi:bifunctional aspartokinase / homoserine dehydrogenase 1